MRKFEVGKRYQLLCNGMRFFFRCTGRNDKYVVFSNVFMKWRIERRINVILDAFNEDMESVRINRNHVGGWLFAEDVA